MRPLELAHLQNFCSKFEIDPQEIDRSLTYHENKAHLRILRIRTIDELYDQYREREPTQTELWDYDESYQELRNHILEVLMGQSGGVLMDWYLIGQEIRLARQKMKLSGADIGPKGFTGEMGKLMNKLSKDIHRRKEELYDAVKYVEKFPDWYEFQQQQFDMPRRRGGVLETFKISGWGLSWHQVRIYLLREHAPKAKVRPNLCWICGKEFFSESANVCENCKTFACPDGHCFCKVAPEVQKAIDFEVMSKGPQPPRWSQSNRKWLKSLYSSPVTGPDIERSKDPVAVA